MSAVADAMVVNLNNMRFLQFWSTDVWDMLRYLRPDDFTQLRPGETPHGDMALHQDEEAYRIYLQASWKQLRPNASSKHFQTQLEQFREHIGGLQIKEKPILVRLPDDTYGVWDGNHRLAVAAARKKDRVPCMVYSLEDFVRKLVMASKARYGVGRGSVPYQSIYSPMGDLILRGRRSDIVRRHRMIAKKLDLCGKIICDLGGNYGGASFLACGAGALHVHHVELELPIVQAAMQMAAIWNLRQMTFYWHDLRDHIPAPDVDVAYIFSITKHVKDLDSLVEYLHDHVRQHLVYETHEGADIEKSICEAFQTQTLLGRLGTRRLYLLSKTTSNGFH